MAKGNTNANNDNDEDDDADNKAAPTRAIPMPTMKTMKTMTPTMMKMR
jgi:hypothetical protein